MKLHLAGIVKRFNIEHPTSNIERRILMALRFIEFYNKRTAESTKGGQVSKG
ncbi:MAG: hypothetical protein WCB15_13665 [Desulfobacterales bacterium]